MIQRLNKINQTTLCLFKTSRKYSTRQIEDKREEKRRLYGIFLNDINRKDFRGDKHENLTYLSNLFNSYQNFIRTYNIRNSSIISHWQSYFSGVNYTTINVTFSYLHEHENYKKLRESILLNFKNYDSKEISFICKTYNAINLRNETDEINLKLNEYCKNNIKKFDLNDIYNISFNKYSTDLNFFQDSSEYVLENIKNDKINSTKLSIDSNDDVFENKMEKYDAESRLWLKLNILTCYEKGFLPSSTAKNTSDWLLNEAQFLIKGDQNEYEINTIISLLRIIDFLSKKTKEKSLKSKLFESFLNEDQDKVFKGLDLCYYKEDYFGYLDVITPLLNPNQLEFLLKYFEVKTKEANNDYLIFLFMKAFDQVLLKKSLNSEYRMKVNLNNRNENRLYLSKHSNRYYYHLVDNLDEKLKRELKDNYNSYISNLNGFNFEFVASSLRLAYNTHPNKQEVLNSFYKAFFNFYSNIKKIDLVHFRKSILFVLEKLIELKDESNEMNKSNEIQLCSILESQFKLYYRQDFMLRSKQNFISFLMLNEETLLKNFKFIKEKLVKDILINYSTFELNEIVHLLNKRQNVLLRDFKQDLIQILYILFKNHANVLLNRNEDIRMIESNIKITDTIIENMKSIKNQKDVKLITNDDKKIIFSGLNEFNLILNESDVQDCVFNENNLFMRLDQRLEALVKMLKYGNYYSENILDELYKFLIQTFLLFLDHSSNVKNIKSKINHLVHVMTLYSRFDYTSNKNYLKHFELFEDLNNKIYNKILRRNIPIQTMSVYVRSLISLNLYVENAFNDLIRNNQVGIHFLK